MMIRRAEKHTNMILLEEMIAKKIKLITTSEIIVACDVDFISLWKWFSWAMLRKAHFDCMEHLLKAGHLQIIYR